MATQQVDGALSAFLVDAAGNSLIDSSGNLKVSIGSVVAAINIVVSSATALTVAKAGTDYIFQVDTSVASAVAGLKLTGAIAAGTVAVAVISTGAAASLTIDAKGTGTIGIGTISTGAITLGRGTTITTGGLTVTAGNLGVGIAAAVGEGLRVQGATLSTNVSQYGIRIDPTFSVAATNLVVPIYGKVITAASAFTAATGATVMADVPTLGATSAITTLYGMLAKNQGATGVTNAYGVYIDAQSGAATTNIGLYNAGTTTLVGITTLSADVYLAATKKLYLDGGGDTYLVESSGNVLDTYTGGTIRTRIDASGNLVIGSAAVVSDSPGLNVRTASANATRDAVTLEQVNTGTSAGVSILSSLYESGGSTRIGSSRITTQKSGTFDGTAANQDAKWLLGVATNGAIVTYLTVDGVAGLVTFGAALAVTGLVSTYNNIATAGWGVPAVYASGRVVGTANARAAAAATYTVGAADGTFEVSGNVLVTASTTHSFSLDVSYTDEGNVARTLILPVAQLAGAFVTGGLITNVTGTGPYEGAVVTIRCKAATSITIRVSAGTFTTVTYNSEGSIKQVA